MPGGQGPVGQRQGVGKAVGRWALARPMAGGRGAEHSRLIPVPGTRAKASKHFQTPCPWSGPRASVPGPRVAGPGPQAPAPGPQAPAPGLSASGPDPRSPGLGPRSSGLGPRSPCLRGPVPSHLSPGPSDGLFLLVLLRSCFPIFLCFVLFALLLVLLFSSCLSFCLGNRPAGRTRPQHD